MEHNNSTSSEYLTANESPPHPNNSESGWSWTPSESNGQNGSSVLPASSNAEIDLLSSAQHATTRHLALDLLESILPYRSMVTKLLYALSVMSVGHLAIISVLSSGICTLQNGANHHKSMVILGYAEGLLGLCAVFLYRHRDGYLYLELFRTYKNAKFFLMICTLMVFLAFSGAVLASIPLKDVFMSTDGGLDQCMPYDLTLVLMYVASTLTGTLVLPQLYQIYKNLHTYKASGLLLSFPGLSVIPRKIEIIREIAGPSMVHVTTGLGRPHRFRRRRSKPNITPLPQQSDTPNTNSSSDLSIHELPEATIGFLLKIYYLVNFAAKLVSVPQLCTASILLYANCDKNTTIGGFSRPHNFAWGFEEGLISLTLFTAGYTFISSGIPLRSFRLAKSCDHFKSKTWHGCLKVLLHFGVTGLTVYPLFERFNNTITNNSSINNELLKIQTPYYLVIGVCSVLGVAIHLARLCVTFNLYRILVRSFVRYPRPRVRGQREVARRRTTVASMDSLPTRSHFRDRPLSYVVM